MDPLVSAIIPCYNAAPWIADAVASVRAQTWRRYEIIFVDDGSTDGSGDLAERLAGPDMRVLHQENRGVCSAWNRGLENAQGDFIQYLDADDILAPDKIEIQLGRLRNLDPTKLASGAWARFDSDVNDAVFVTEDVWRDLSPVDWLVTSWSGGGMMHGAAWLAPRNVIAAAGPWDESLTLINDLDYFTRLLLSSSGVAFCADAKTYYRSNVAGSLSRRNSRHGWESAFRATESSSAALLARELSERTKKASAINLQRLVHNAYPSAPDLVIEAERRIAELGGSDLIPGGGRVFQGLRRIVGWKVARRLQIIGRKLA